MRYWIDTEFIEDGRTIELISIGIISEDDRELYLINQECDFSKASDWVLTNVLIPIGLDRSGFSVNPSDPSNHPTYRDSYLVAHNRKEIARRVMAFIKPEILAVPREDKGYQELHQTSPVSKPEFWAYYASYDWVVLCQLFGTMMDLPKGFPMYCRDIKQWCDQLSNPQLPEQEKGEHNALEDARHNKVMWEFLQNYTRSDRP